jgi:hypothetical protein
VDLGRCKACMCADDDDDDDDAAVARAAPMIDLSDAMRACSMAASSGSMSGERSSCGS